MIIRYYFLLLLIFTCLFSNATLGQTKDARESFPYVYATYTFQVPGGDLGKVFGEGYEVGGGAGFKSKSNWMLGAEATYFFGNDVKQNTLEGLLNSSNQITNMYGEPGIIDMREAGFKVIATIGKITPIFGVNKNSGLFLRGNVGFLQHKIFIESAGNNIPQVMGDYVKGYDRLSNGIMVGEFVGWQNFSDNGAYHFLVGFEFTQAFTENRRNWDFASNQKIEGRHLDLMYALKLAYYIPFRQKKSTGYFYY